MKYVLYYMTFFLHFRLNVTILPLLLHRHQFQLDFLFTSLGAKRR